MPAKKKRPKHIKDAPLITAEMVPTEGPLHPSHTSNYDESPEVIRMFLERWNTILKKDKSPVFKAVKAEAAEYSPFVLNYLTSVKRSLFGYKFEHSKGADQLQDELIKDKLSEFFHSTLFDLLLTLIRNTPEDINKIPTFKKPAHLVDQILKYNQSPLGLGKQLDIWDTLSPVTKSKIEQSGTSIEMINMKGEGIYFTSTEHKLMDCIHLRLHEKSQNRRPELADYYAGDGPIVNIPYAGQETTAPAIYVTLYELAKMFNGGGVVGGDVIATVRDTLNRLANDPDKKALFRFTRQITDKRRGKIKQEIEEYMPLLRMPGFKETLEDGSEVKETLIILNPIFRDQIADRFVVYPIDIIQRMFNATGKKKIPEVTYRLREFLAKELSWKNLNPERNESTLYWMLNEKFMKNHKGKEVKLQFLEAAEVMKKIGLLDSYEFVIGASGQQKVVFSLFEEWK